MSREQEIVEKLLSFAFAMSENMIGLGKGNYDENTFIKKTYEYLQKYTIDRNEQKAIKQSVERLEAIDNATPSEALERLAMPDELHISECKKLGISLTEDYDLLEQALLELQSIKGTNPSEALDCLEVLEQDIKDRIILDEDRQLKLCATIKQSLQKAQEQKQYLKWEDLEFNYGTKEQKVKMGDTIYKIVYSYYGRVKEVQLFSEDEKYIYFHFFDNFEEHIKLFNDLHLEVVE